MNANIQNTESGHTHNRHVAPAHSRNLNGGGNKNKSELRAPRNSNVEILRIFAMLCIAFNHFPWPAQEIVGSGSLSQRLPMSIVLSLISNLGGVGDCLFFFISIWYICEESVNYKRQFKRVWILERELLFWSLLFLVCDLLSQASGFQDIYSKKELLKHLIHGLFPALSTHWWFPTNYMLFLLIVPVLSTGLRKAGEQLHKILAIILFALYGFVPFGFMNNLAGELHPTMNYSVWLFIYQFVLITYIRWYKPNWLKSKSLMTKFMWIGVLFGVLSQTVCVILTSVVSNACHSLRSLWMNNPACFPSMMFALGLLALAQQKKPWRNKAINKIASATLTVYLIFTDFFTGTIISTCTHTIPQSGMLLFLSSFALCLTSFLLAILLGLIRQILFSVTFDRRRGYCFELLWNKISNKNK